MHNDITTQWRLAFGLLKEKTLFSLFNLLYVNALKVLSFKTEGVRSVAGDRRVSQFRMKNLG